MADESTVTLTYNGPPAYVVEIEREVSDGDEVEVSEALAGRLLCASGFSGGPSRIQPPEPLEPPPPTGYRVEDLERAQEAAGASASAGPGAQSAALEDLPKDELLSRAQNAEIEGASSMNKAELVEALEEIG